MNGDPPFARLRLIEVFVPLWEAAGFRMSETVSFLWKLGYACFALLPEGGFVPVSGPFWPGEDEKRKGSFCAHFSDQSGGLLCWLRPIALGPAELPGHQAGASAAATRRAYRTRSRLEVDDSEGFTVEWRAPRAAPRRAPR